MTISFKLYYEHGALNSKPIFDAFAHSIKHLGFKIVDKNEDVSVLWSALWHGRMSNNKQVYEFAKSNNKQVIFIEVGNINRGVTWRISLDNVNALGYFGNDSELDDNRPSKIGPILLNENTARRKEILIAGQHEKSLQWNRNISYSKWLELTISSIRSYTDMPVKFRYHPRANYVQLPKIQGVSFEIPQKLNNTYDSFDFNANYHCVINYNSGPSVSAAISGTPIICDSSSLASPVSSPIETINFLILPNRDKWAISLSHTEWTIDEIKNGIPLSRLLAELNRRLCI